MTFWRKYPFIFLFVIAMHGWWTYLLATVPEQVSHIVGIHLLWSWVGATGAALVYAGVSVLALASLVLDAGQSQWARTLGMLALLPQEVTLIASAMSAMSAMSLGQYADGYEAPWQFISADQMYHPVLLLAHTAAMVAIYWPRHDSD